MMVNEVFRSPSLLLPAASLYYLGQVSASGGCCGSGKWWVWSCFKFSDERLCAPTNHYVILHIQQWVLSGFEVLHLTYYMLSWAIWNWLYLNSGGRLISKVNIVSSQKLLAHIVALNGQEKQTGRRGYINPMKTLV